jgi:hypothetical protein
MNDPTSHPWTLRHLPLAARLTLAVFLTSVGIGYASALVQLHLQHASPGQALPTREDAVRIFHGDDTPPVSTIERLLTADEHEHFNGTGQMRTAFTKRSEGWKGAIKEKAREMGKGRRGEANQAAAEEALRQERETERHAVLEWIRAGASKTDYKRDSFCLPDNLAQQPITPDFLVTEAEPRAVKIRSLLQARCVRCHAPDSDDGQAAQYPLDTYERLAPYVAKRPSSAMSLTKLAQSTHVHLLGFSLLYGMTGLILAFSSYPRLIRVVLCPLPLAAQVVDISFWWLARLDAPYGPQFAQAIVVSGGIVGAGLFLHILLSLWDLFGKGGRLVLVLLAVGATTGAYYAKERVIDPYLAQEARPAAAP